MSRRTIAKNFHFVILGVLIALTALSCSHAPSGAPRGPQFDEAKSPYEKARIIGQIKSSEITESSGLAASLCQPNVLWTHNDSGDGPYIYAMDSTGANLGTWKVRNAENSDWEDMAAIRNADGQCFLYIGEIGNTEKLTRSVHKIYRVREPVILPQDANSLRADARDTEPAEVLSFKYPEASHDAETLLVHPTTGDLYVLTKQRSRPSSIYKIKAAFGGAVALGAQKIGEITVPAIPNGLLTGGSISPDGSRVILCDYAAAYEISLPAGAGSFDEIWKQKPVAIDLGSRKQGEAISYSADGASIFATSEGRRPPVIEVKRR